MHDVEVKSLGFFIVSLSAKLPHKPCAFEALAFIFLAILQSLLGRYLPSSLMRIVFAVEVKTFSSS